MAKMIAMLTVLVASFMLAVIVPMAANGRLNKESLDRILGREAVLEVVEEDPAGPLVESLNTERARLSEWDSKLRKQADLLAIREGELSATWNEVRTIQAEITAAMDELDDRQTAGMTEVANTLATMEAKNAAVDLEAMTPEQAALLLPMIDERARGEILDSMTDTQHRALIFQVMQEAKY